MGACLGNNNSHVFHYCGCSVSVQLMCDHLKWHVVTVTASLGSVKLYKGFLLANGMAVRLNTYMSSMLRGRYPTL